jgi:two-component system, LuxR family, response regulator FixJ
MSHPTVFLVDDDASVRDSLSLLLSLKGLRTQIFASAEHFLDTYDSGWRGCLLTDLRLTGMSGLELQRVLRERGINLPVVVITAHGDVATTRTALQAGALDFLEKPLDDEVLIDVLRNAIQVDQARHSEIAAKSMTVARLERLTPRERQVFDFLADGLQNRDIAEHLAISPRTVEVYKARIMEKLQCRNLADAVKLSIAVATGNSHP